MRKPALHALVWLALALVSNGQGLAQDLVADGEDPQAESLLCQQTSAPPCCGDPCGGGERCCHGTVCSHAGRCIPRACVACGDRGCDVDWDTCTATCGPIRCCRESCRGDADCCTGAVCRPVTAGGLQCLPTECDDCTAQGRTCQVLDDCRFVCGGPVCCQDLCNHDRDCCTGTRCLPTVAGESRCLPSACAACSGMTPSCEVSSDCEATCIPPPSCGEDCTSNADCGVGSRCQEFAAGRRRCVPSAFERECRACGSAGCHFSVDSCSVQCASP